MDAASTTDPTPEPTPKPTEGAVEPEGISGEHFVGRLGLEQWHEGGLAHGRAELRPEMSAPATGLPRIAVLATMVDIVAGFPPGGAMNPTVDLRVTLLSPPPTSGTVELVCRPAKLGRRLFVGETILHTGDPDRPFARSTVTFMNQRMGDAPRFGPRQPIVGGPSFDELLQPRFPVPGTVAMDVHPSVSNGPGGTIQGGAQALLAELAAEQALASRGNFTPVDLEIRYLNRVRTPSVAATAEVLEGDLAGACVRVPIHELGGDERIVSLASFLCREVSR